MTRYVITPGVAIDIAESGRPMAPDVKLVAPTLFRSQVLSTLYRRALDGRLSHADALAVLEHVQSLRIRLLGDRVMQAQAWKLAAELGLDGTFEAEYIALTRLQADALVTDDEQLASIASKVVAVADVAALVGMATADDATS